MATEAAHRRGERSGEFLGGKYLLEACLGIGGMGEVYRATNVSLGRKVAIKVLGRDMVDNEDDVLRFLREARAAAAVRHPNVVDVLDVARDDDGTPFIVQELLSGEDLERYVRARGGSLPVQEALEILVPVADAVAEAHARDVVHRDLKPANIFLAREGTRITPKVLDFGACLFPTMGGVDARERRMLIGTPHYMAPEQVVDRAGVDARADVWALGVILWELVVGEPPFQGPTAMDVLRLVKAKEVPPLRERLPDAPKPLADLVAACTTRDKNARIADAGALAVRMRAVRDALRPPTRPSIETLPDVTELLLEDAPPSSRTGTKGSATSAPPPPRDRLESEDDGLPSGLDLALEAKDPRHNTPSSMPPVLDARQAMTSPRSQRAADPTSGVTPAGTTPRTPATESRVAEVPPAKGAPGSGSMRTATPLAVTTTPRTPRTPMSPITLPRPVAPVRPPLARREVGRIAGLVVGPAVVLHVLFRFVPVTRFIGQALRGDSIVASAIATVLVLVVAAALAAKCLSPERERTTEVAAGGAFLLGILMIIMTFSASESAALGIPPALSELVPFVAPVLPAALAVAMFGRAREAWSDPVERRGAVGAVVLASLLVLLALEVGPTGAVRSAAAAASARSGS